MTSEAEEIDFDGEESPTRRSGIVLARAEARETEMLLGQQDAIVHLAISREGLAWFPLGGDSAAIVAAADGHTSMNVVLERAGLSLSEGMPHVRMLVAMGVVALK